MVVCGNATATFDAHKVYEARRYASELLESTRSLKLREFLRDDGNAIYQGNLVLGRCALMNGDVEYAKQHLLASGRTNGSPQLDSFGPNMSLAKELLKHGESEVVLAYFELCKSFWKSGASCLKQWADAVVNGQIPEFGANLHY